MKFICRLDRRNLLAIAYSTAYNVDPRIRSSSFSREILNSQHRLFIDIWKRKRGYIDTDPTFDNKQR